MIYVCTAAGHDGNRSMACIATVFGSGLGGRISVSDRKNGGESYTSVRYIRSTSSPQTIPHILILSS